MPQPRDPASAQTAGRTRSLPDDQALTVPSAGSAAFGAFQASPHSFAPEAVAAGRYRIVRFIAQGGMGEVYEAEDLELRERVALKTIAPALAADHQAVERFKREVLLARKVSHPNVCRLLELGVHQPGSGPRVLFLTMELLGGETLEARLKRVGPLSQSEALPLVLQMCAALAAAHDAGVVHRDFKSSNVMLVPSKDALRLVVTDFGLARLCAAEDNEGSSITRAGIVVGTPAYLAPEQLEGGKATAASDLYALGVVLYEMLTGTQPFSGPMPGRLYRRLLEPAPSPRQHAPELDAVWEAVILGCLEQDPAQRFASAAEVVQTLQGQTTQGLRPVQRRRSVAVLGFKSLSGKPDAAWLSTALSEMLGTELAAGERLRIIPSENVARMKLELSLTEADSFGRETLLRIRQNLGADLLVLGSYLALPREDGHQIRLDLRLQDAAAGETAALVSETGSEADFFTLVSRTGARLRETLGIEQRPAAAAAEVKASLPSNPEAARLYVQGLAALRGFDDSAAERLLEGAIELEPGFPLAHSALAEAWSTLGYEVRAKQAAKRAYELRESLAREERLLVEARYRTLHGELDLAAEIYQALFTFFPDNVEYGLSLVLAQESASRFDDAFRTIEALRKLPAPACEDPEIDVREAGLVLFHRDYASGLERAERAEARAAERGAQFLRALALMLQGDALRNLGEPDRAIAVYEAARQIYASLGNRVHDGMMLQRIGMTLSEHGSHVEARRHFEAFLELCRQIGSKSEEYWALMTLGNTLGAQGDLAVARAMFEEALALALELNDQRFIAKGQSGLAHVLLEQEDLVGARAFLQPALEFHRRFEYRSDLSTDLCLLGAILRAEGKLREAEQSLEEAAEIRLARGSRAGPAKGERRERPRAT